MKKILYSLCLLSLIFSCKSIDKLVERGQYDAAIVLATKKLAGKKNKKTSHVRNLEKAFDKITSIDMDKINALDAVNNSYNWEEVLAISNKIERRQNKINAFLPLISKEGYHATFEFVKTNIIKNKALDGSAEHHYKIAKNFLENASLNQDKKQAQRAYYTFKEIEKFRNDYKDSGRLKSVSRNLGVIEILLHVDNEEVFTFEEELLLEDLNKIAVSELNEFWKNYHLEDDSLTQFDFISSIKLSDLQVSPEREQITNHTDKKKIMDGWEYVKKKNGEIKTDSLGNKLKRDVFRNVKADVSEMTRKKTALLSANLITRDAKSLNIIDTVPVQVETHFSDYSLRFRGDKRALCNHDVHRLKDNPLPFPDDISMILDAGLELKHDLIHELKDMRL